MRQFLTFSAFLFFFPQSAVAQLSDIQWLRTLITPDNLSVGDVFPHGIETDANNNITLLATYVSSVNFDNGSSLEHGGFDDEDRVMILRYNSDGDVLWKNTIKASNSNEYDIFGRQVRIGVDNGGNVYVAGRLKSPELDFGNGVVLNKNCGGLCEEIFIAKYDNNGIPQWVNRIGAPNGAFNQIAGIDCDSEGNVIVGGLSGGTSLTYNDSTYTGLKKDHQFLLKLTANGDALWLNAPPTSSGQVLCRAVRTGPDGSVYVSGDYFTSINLGNGLTKASFGIHNAYVAKYNRNGVPQWVHGLTGQDVDILDMNIDEQGTAFLSCDSGSSISFDGTPLVNANASFVGTMLKADSTTATVLFQINYDNGEIYPVMTNAVRPDGSAYYAAGVYGFDIAIGNIVLSSEGNSDLLVVEGKDTTLTPVSFGGNKAEAIENFDYGSAIALDQNGYLYVVGFNAPDGRIGTFELDNAGIFVAKLNTGTVGTSTPVVQTAHIAPNPTTGAFRVRVPGLAGQPAQCTITSAEGRVMLRQAITQEEFWVQASLPAGSYQMTIRSAEKVWRQQLAVVER
jgi:hypothetical protein